MNEKPKRGSRGQDELSTRYEAILDKWEQQADRFDRVLERWEAE
ncbi:hypothetical protein [Pseudobythopirellula maris]|nr:hypothetical protein [Pseudobythopirellula maris]